MANKLYYLEPDEEITQVIEKIRKSDERGVILVVPRSSSIAQSVINLKLLAKSAASLDKTIGLVSNDRVTKNLAGQLKLRVFDNVKEAEKSRLGEISLPKPEKKEPEVILPPLVDENGLKVHTYQKYDPDAEGVESDEDAPEDDFEEEDGDDQADIEPEDEPVYEDDEEPVQTRERRPESKISARQPDPRKEVVADDEPERGEEEYTDDEIEDQEEEVEGEAQFRHTSIDSKTNDEPAEYKKGGAMKLTRNSDYRRKSNRRKKIILILSGILLVVAIGLAAFLLPEAKASVVLKTAEFEKKTTFTVDVNQQESDIGNLAVPGQIVEIEKDIVKTFNSSGKRDAGAPATGTITISNAVSTKSVPVSPGTKVTSADGKIFSVKAGVMVPGATISNPQLVDGKLTYDTAPGTVDAILTASTNGEDYNLASGTKFSLTTSSGQLSATAKSAFSGGVTKDILFVTEDDLKGAEKTVKDSVLSDSKGELITEAGGRNLSIFADHVSVEIISTTATKNANDEAETFQVQSKVKLSTIGYSEIVLRDAMIELVNSQIGVNTMLVNPDKGVLENGLSDYDANTGKIKLDSVFKGRTGSKLSDDELIKSIAGKSTSSAESYLSGQDGVDRVTISSQPKFWKRMPFAKNRISIQFDFQQ